LKAFFDVLATQSDVKFLSTPQVMVLDNQTANIRVGDQIPVTTRSSQSTRAVRRAPRTRMRRS
jgi:general secretion pathway protein D